MARERIYLICPARNATEEEKKVLDEYVRKLESKGHEVHYPPRDVEQNDETGMNIVMSHKRRMKWCTQVHAFWNPRSEGSVFDLGMLVAGEKPLKIINKTAIEDWLAQNPGKSYTRVAYELARIARLE